MSRRFTPSVAVVSLAAAGSLAFGVTGSANAAPATDAMSGDSAAGARQAGHLTNFGFNAASYGSKTDGNPDADSDATAVSFLPCTRYVPRSDDNVLASAGDGDGVDLNGVRTHNFTVDKSGPISAISTVHIDNGTLANGQIGFRDLTGRVRSYHDAHGFHATTVSTIAELTVGGAPVPMPDDGQEVEIPVPGLGTLTLNHARAKATPMSAGGAVNVMRFDGDDGTTEKVGRAGSRIDGNVEGGLFAGAAWGSDARVGDVAALGRGALQPIPCAGTNGKVHESSTGQAMTDAGFLGARRSFANGVQKDNGSATGYTRSFIDSATFGAGVLEFRNIKARANVTRRTDGDVVRDSQGTGVGKILVNGQVIDSPPPGEAQHVEGLGTFTVRHVERTKRGIEVTGVIVRLENGTPDNRSDDTIVNLARAVLQIKKG